MFKPFFIIALLFSFFCYSNSSIAGGNPASWKVSELARAPTETIHLNNKAVQTQQMLYLYAAMQSISEVAELNTEFIITEGNIPNAFATISNNGLGIIGINFAMLDILGKDLDMAAALIGHELAHLKLHHLNEHREAIIRNRNQPFSAKNTRYNRDNEREADYLGVIWAIEAGYNPEGAIKLQEILYDLNKKYASSNTSISHPSSIERLTVLKSLVRRIQN